MPTRFGGIVFDMDGVLFRGRQAISGAPEAVARAREAGLKASFLTNNSTRHRRTYVDKLRALGIPAGPADVMSSAYAAALYLRDELAGRPATAYVVGGRGLEEELREVGLRITDGTGPVDFVVVGMDTSFTYEKLYRAQQAIVQGAQFIATNTDPVYPTETGFQPGGGAIVAALEACVRRPPDLIVGKPRPVGVQMLVRAWDLPPECCALIGDQIGTDIVAGNRAGVYTILVLTGISSREQAQLAQGEEKPEGIFEDVGAAAAYVVGH